MSSEFIPPSDEIKRLFTLDTSSKIEEGLSKPATVADDVLFTEDDLSKIPSTLLKAIRRTNTLLIQTEAARKMAIEMNNELKSINTLLLRHAKKAIKNVEKPDADSNLEKGKPRGFRRQCRISDLMCEFMGLPPGTMSSRVEVNQAINAYIKEHQLVDKENAQKIIPDEKLWSLLSASARGNKITYFSIQKYLTHHY